MNLEIKIRKAVLSDIDRLMEIFAKAREFMKNTGNPNQWINGYPQRELISDEILKGHCYVCCADSSDESRERIVATFCFIEGPDPTYSYIENGSWPNNLPYYVIHRLASDGTVPGIAAACIDLCSVVSPCLRADTHKDNKVMQHILERNGFKECGIIYVANGTQRIAYQKDAK